MFSAMEREYIYDHGWKIDEDGILVLTPDQFRKYQYTGTSVRDRNVKTLMLPSDNGCCLIFEGKHFKIA